MQRTLFDAPSPNRRDGETFDQSRDGQRLAGLHARVAAFMSDGQWHTLAEIQAACGGTESSCSARLRDFRKARFGGHTVEREYVGDGLWQYRLTK